MQDSKKGAKIRREKRREAQKKDAGREGKARALLVLLDRPFKAALTYFALGIPAEHFSFEFLHSAYIAASVDSRLTEILYIHRVDLTCTLVVSLSVMHTGYTGCIKKGNRTVICYWAFNI